jgi:hypothetical protein
MRACTAVPNEKLFDNAVPVLAPWLNTGTAPAHVERRLEEHSMGWGNSGHCDLAHRY